MDNSYTITKQHKTMTESNYNKNFTENMGNSSILKRSLKIGNTIKKHLIENKKYTVVENNQNYFYVLMIE